jgi:prevent-host-death family protein
MDRVTIRDLRNTGGEVIDRVMAGRSLVVTRDGRPVAELHPVRPHGVDREVLVERWKNLPAADFRALRADIDALVDPAL